MARNDAAVLEVKDLRVSFNVEAGTLKAVDGLDFTLEPGEVLGIVGESGSGKSVSMLSITDLIKKENRDTRGSAKFLGKDLLMMDQDTLGGIRGKDIGFVFQNPMSSLNPTMRIGAQIAEGMLHHGAATRADVKDKVVALLDKVGIREPAKRYSAYPHELSGGMAQRVNIALAIAKGSRILLVDEPTSALDPSLAVAVLDVFRDLVSLGMGLMWITHDLRELFGFADEVVVMHQGETIDRCPGETRPEEAFSHPAARALCDATWGRR